MDYRATARLLGTLSESSMHVRLCDSLSPEQSGVSSQDVSSFLLAAEAIEGRLSENSRQVQIAAGSQDGRARNPEDAVNEMRYIRLSSMEVS